MRLTRPGRKALWDPPAVTLRRVWDKWLGTTIRDELSRVECVKGQTGKGKRSLTAVASRREAIAETSAQCPVMRWIGTDDLMCHPPEVFPRRLRLRRLSPGSGASRAPRRRRALSVGPLRVTSGASKAPPRAPGASAPGMGDMAVRVRRDAAGAA